MSISSIRSGEHPPSLGTRLLFNLLLMFWFNVEAKWPPVAPSQVEHNHDKNGKLGQVHPTIILKNK